MIVYGSYFNNEDDILDKIYSEDDACYVHVKDLSVDKENYGREDKEKNEEICDTVQEAKLSKLSKNIKKKNPMICLLW